MVRKLPPLTLYYLYEFAVSLLMTTMFALNMVYQVTVVQLSPLQLVLVGTTLEIAAFLGEIPTGIVADVYSRRLSVIIGVALIGLGFLLEGTIPTFAAVLLAQVIWGLGATFTSGAWEAWITDEVGPDVAGRAFVRGSQLGLLASLGGIGLAVLLGKIALNVPIVVGAIGLLVFAVVLIVLMPETGFTPTPKEDRNTWQTMAHTFTSGARVVRGNAMLLAILGVSLVHGLFSEGFDRLNTPHILSFGFPAWGGLDTVTWWGIISVVGTLLSLAATTVVQKYVPMNKQRILIGGLAITDAMMLVGIIAFAWSGNIFLALGAFWVVGMARTIQRPFYSAWANRNIDSRVRATVLSMGSQLNALGQIGGGPAIGFVGNRSLRAALTIAALLISPNFVLYRNAQGYHGENTADETGETVLVETA